MLGLGLRLGLFKRNISIYSSIISAFKSSVLADGGTFEAESCLNTTVQYLVNNNLYDSASLIVTPNAYKTSKIYSLKGSDLTFSRASVANRTNPVGVIESVGSNIARLEYPSCPSWLIEPQRTNIVTYSIDFANAAWTKSFSATITANATTSPDGTNNASMISVGASAFSGIYTAVSGASGKYSNSIYAKKGTFNFVYFVDITGTTAVAWFNLNTGVVGTVVSGYSAKITDSINGFYKCEVTRTGANQVPVYFQIGASSADNTNGGSTGNIYIWQAQAELGDYSTSPINTTGSTVTRIADVATQTRTFTTNSTTYIKALLNADSLSNSVAYGIIDIRTGSNNRYSLYRFNNTIQLDIVNSTVLFSGSILTIPTLVLGTVYKIAIVTTATTFVVYINGVAVYTNNSVSVPTLTSANLNYGSINGITQWNGILSDLQIWDSAFNSSAAIALTT
jgi:hypothetical protein